jgi:haloacetate dehalogenase
MAIDAHIRELGAAPLMAGFELLDVDVADDITIRAAAAGRGSPVLLLHGHPHTHVVWRKIAPRLAERFTVVTCDLRGYGDSSKPPGGDNHIAYSKRVMAEDQISAMRALGHERFAVVGHDRGARVAHRMAPSRGDHAHSFAKHCSDVDDVCAHRQGIRHA